MSLKGQPNTRTQLNTH